MEKHLRQPAESDIEKNEEITKFTTGKGEEYTTGDVVGFWIHQISLKINSSWF